MSIGAKRLIMTGINRAINAGSTFCGAEPQSERKVRSRERLGGLLRFYHREAV